MSFLSSKNKKKSAFPKLTEKDIQEKLYGSFLKGFRVDTSAEDTLVQVAETETRIERPVPPKPSENILKSQTEGVLIEDAVTHPEGKTVTGSPFVKEGADKSFVRIGAKEPRPFPRQVTVKKVAREVKPKVKLKIPQVPYGKIKEVFKNGSGKAVEGSVLFLSWILQGLHKGAGFVYSHRGSLKKLSLWLLGGFTIFALFASVHYLNIQRENSIHLKPRVILERQVQTVRAPESVSPISQPNQAVDERLDTAYSAEVSEGVDKKTELELVQDSGTTHRKIQGQFAIQVATYVLKSDADHIAESLSKKGWPSFVRGVPRAGGRIFYSVYLGRYQTFLESQQELSKFKKSEFSETFKDAFIRTLKD